MTQKKCVTICSGGMDSVTLAYYIANEGYSQKLISFNYGQRHKKELLCAAKAAAALQCTHHIIDLTTITPLLHGSSLTSDIPVPEGHYAQDNMRITVVPNRNAIMLSIAYGAAVADGAEALFYGAHAGDHQIYDDCRPAFVLALDHALMLGNASTANPYLRIESPFIGNTKAEIVRVGTLLGVPYEDTWTCYKGGMIACGTCGTCVERLEAFALNELDDPLPYLDRKTWKKHIAQFQKGK